ncbi:ATP-binding cassette domain-containing protein [Breoghania sp.]|uniref:ATP-binding cassette domain-containing protein n=1 Tax=Breoghania sp. TaxID=2065378 RepID=UPI002620B0F4|nr:ATP-binding cassette domain-containing protein [Breoghania sp.]
MSSSRLCLPAIRNILFDEPTTALDVITARQILDLLSEIQEKTGVVVLYISHDLALVSRVAWRVSVIYRGEIMESRDVESVFTHPEKEYTRALIGAVPNPARRLVGERTPEDDKPLVEADKVTVQYGRYSFLGSLMGREVDRVLGNNAVSLSVGHGEILGTVGESGSGKSTLAKAMTGLNPFTGEIRFDGRTIKSARDMDKAYRCDVQLIFQHPDASLNPRHRIREILSRPLDLYGLASGAEARAEKIGDLLEGVRLPRDYAERFPHQLFGGEKQRAAIARAFASRPRLDSMCPCRHPSSSCCWNCSARWARPICSSSTTSTWFVRSPERQNYTRA